MSSLCHLQFHLQSSCQRFYTCQQQFLKPNPCLHSYSQIPSHNYVNQPMSSLEMCGCLQLYYIESETAFLLTNNPNSNVIIFKKNYHSFSFNTEYSLRACLNSVKEQNSIPKQNLKSVPMSSALNIGFFCTSSLSHSRSLCNSSMLYVASISWFHQIRVFQNHQHLQ